MKKNLLLVLINVIAMYSYFSFECRLLANSNENNLDETSSAQKVIWDIQLTIELNNGIGVEFDGSFFYVSDTPSSIIYKYNLLGALIDSFQIPGVSNLSDLAFDGTYMYGGSGSQTIYQMDFITHTLVGTISSPINVRHIAYDEINDAFWVGSWSEPLALVSRSGTLLNIFNHSMSFITGTAYDDVSPGGPYLWIFDRGNSIPGPQLIYQLHIPSLTFTGVTHDVLSDVGIGQPDAVAGGLFSTGELFLGTFSLGGILIGDPTILFSYELHNSIPVELTNFTALYLNGKVLLEWETATEINNSGFEIQRKENTNNDNWERLGFVVGAGTSSKPCSYNFTDEHILAGIYFYRLKQIDYNGNFSFSEKIQTNIYHKDFKLHQNFPNPFNPSTKIKFTIPIPPVSSPLVKRKTKEGFVTLKVYDVLGNEVAILADEDLSAGEYEVTFDVAQISNPGLTSGVYFYQLKSGDFMQTKKMILIR